MKKAISMMLIFAVLLIATTPGHAAAKKKAVPTKGEIAIADLVLQDMMIENEIEFATTDEIVLASGLGEVRQLMYALDTNEGAFVQRLVDTGKVKIHPAGLTFRITDAVMTITPEQFVIFIYLVDEKHGVEGWSTSTDLRIATKAAQQ